MNWRAFVLPVAITLIAAALAWQCGSRLATDRAAQQTALDQLWIEQAEDFIRYLITSPPDAAGPDDLVILLGQAKDIAVRLLYEAPGAAASRARKRRCGF